MIFKENPSITEKVFVLREYGGVYDGIKGSTQVFEEGMYGNGVKRKDNLYKAIQTKVNQLMKGV